MQPDDPLGLVIEGGLGLDPATAEALRRAANPPEAVRPGDRLASEGDAPAGLRVVLSGVLKACRNLDNGHAQTVALFAPGDVLGAHGMALGREPATLAAVTASRVALVPDGRLRELRQAHPRLVEALWRSLARETSILQEWMVGMGRRAAMSQVAHLLCELAVRLPRSAGRTMASTTFRSRRASLPTPSGCRPCM